MKNVAELDKNMAVMTRVDDETLVWRSAREQPFRLEGLYDPYAPGPYRRLPQDVAEATSEGRGRSGASNALRAAACF